MYILRVRTKDSGDYKVVAVNSFGKAECSTKLNVRGKSSLAFFQLWFLKVFYYNDFLLPFSID